MSNNLERLISIILPVFNSELFISHCLNSLLNQTYKNLEIIIIDDGSTDGSYQICTKFALQDKRIKLFKQKNSGPGIARNNALKLINGYYVFFIDADDYIAPDTLNSLVGFLQKYNCDIVQCGSCYVYDNYGLIKKNDKGKTILMHDNTVKELILQREIKNFAWGKLYKSSIIKDILFPDQRFFEDFHWMEHAIHNANRYGILHSPLYFYRQHKDSHSNKIPQRDLIYKKVLDERLGFIQKNYPSLLPLMKKQISSYIECDSWYKVALRWYFRIKNRFFFPYDKVKIND